MNSHIHKHTSTFVVLEHVSLNPNTYLNAVEKGPGTIVPILYPGTAKQRAVHMHALCTSPDEVGHAGRLHGAWTCFTPGRRGMKERKCLNAGGEKRWKETPSGGSFRTPRLFVQICFNFFSKTALICVVEPFYTPNRNTLEGENARKRKKTHDGLIWLLCCLQARRTPQDTATIPPRRCDRNVASRNRSLHLKAHGRRDAPPRRPIPVIHLQSRVQIWTEQTLTR